MEELRPARSSKGKLFTGTTSRRKRGDVIACPKNISQEMPHNA